jgi:hypothetical protein
MSRKKRIGTCRICGFVGELSFEHVPPKSAYNNQRLFAYTFEKTHKIRNGEKVYADIQQGGAGSYTLCQRCNNFTGSYYASHFVEWCKNGFEILEMSNGNPSLITMNLIYPLRILKQIITMFFSMESGNWREFHSELERFVLNRDSKYLNPNYRFFIYYCSRNEDNVYRRNGMSALGDINKHTFTVISEISHPPFGYVMTIDSQPDDSRLCEITNFANFGYNEFIHFSRKLSVLPTVTQFSGDYRTQEEVYEQVVQTKLEMEINRHFASSK